MNFDGIIKLGKKETEPPHELQNFEETENSYGVKRFGGYTDSDFTVKYHGGEDTYWLSNVSENHKYSLASLSNYYALIYTIIKGKQLVVEKFIFLDK